MTNIVTMIPVRMASTRLPNKPLLDINGKSLLQRVYENVKKTVPGDVFVAAGDRVIVEACEKFGAKAVLTDPALPSGTDRIAAALKEIDPEGKYDIVVNFQGDAVNVNPAVNNELIAMIERTGCDRPASFTLYCWTTAAVFASAALRSISQPCEYSGWV